MLVKALMTGKIVSLMVKVGDPVEENDPIALLEAMKMEMPLVTPIKGVVKDIYVAPNQEVDGDTTVAVVE